MPHLTIEHSANLAECVDIAELVNVTHAAALDTGVAPLAGLRTRAVATAPYRIADGHPDNSYLAITARLAPRSAEDKTRFMEGVLAAVLTFLGDAAHRTSISIEIQDIDPEFRINVNNIGTRMEEAT